MSENIKLVQKYLNLLEDYEDALTVKTVREITKLDEKTIYRLIKNKKLECVKPRLTRFFIPKLGLIKFLITEEYQQNKYRYKNII